jgi:GntR family transcriptional regulator, transcriptional repressor for pyruvate dehydrogenase complex
MSLATLDTLNDSGAVTQKNLLKRSSGLSQQLVGHLQERIQAGSLQPGDKLPTEAALVREFGVSRTVVREALSRLQASGLAQTQHGVGSFVLAPSQTSVLSPNDIANAQDVLAIMELRMSLETEAAALAAQRRSAEQLLAMRQALDDFQANIQPGGSTVAADIAFHLCIAQSTGNRYFVEVMHHLSSTLLPRTRGNMPEISETEMSAYLQRVNQEHEQIYAGIARQDIEAARAAMRLHLGNGRERQRRMLQELSDST